MKEKANLIRWLFIVAVLQIVLCPITKGEIILEDVETKYGGGTGEPNDPYQIATAEDLVLLGNSPEDYDKHFILTADIDLDPNLPGCKVFDKAVIGEFKGVFEGNGHTVSRMTIIGGSNLGLFEKLATTAKITNLDMEEIYVCGSYFSGGLVGYNRGSITNCRLSGSISSGSAERGSRLGLLVGNNLGKISHCEVYGTVTAGDLFWRIGGLAGENSNSVANCHSSCSLVINSIYAGTGYYGGLIGFNSGAINRCYATGDISYGKYSENVGGLAGYNSGSIIGCYANGNVSGSYANWRLGGLVGKNYGHIMYCFATGNVNGSGSVGGLVGNDRGTISHAYATGQVVGKNLSYIPIGGLVGDGYPDNVNSCYWDIETSGQTTSEGGTGKTSAQMQTESTFTNAGWDFADERNNGTCDVWQMPAEGGYPELIFFSDIYQRHELTGSGTQDDPFLIATAEDLGAILHGDSSACYRLTADVNLTGIKWSTAVIPSFGGTFDGNGFTISNLTIHGGDYLGLFGALEKSAVVENLGITDANIIGSSSASDLGILAVENWGYIADCQITGSVSGGQYEEHLGGIVRYNVGTITNCDPVDYDGPYCVIISDQEAIRQFLLFEGIDFNEIWIPQESDIENLDSILRTYLNSDESAQANTWIGREYILDNFPRYDREYSGFILNDSKYIICQMILWSGFQGSCFIAEYEPGSKFTIIYDGGCGVVRVIFDAESKTVISISCNGMA